MALFYCLGLYTQHDDTTSPERFGRVHRMWAHSRQATFAESSFGLARLRRIITHVAATSLNQHLDAGRPPPPPFEGPLKPPFKGASRVTLQALFELSPLNCDPGSFFQGGLEGSKGDPSAPPHPFCPSRPRLSFKPPFKEGFKVTLQAPL